MEKRGFGKTGVEVAALGFGAMELLKLDKGEAAKLLNAALDGGVNFIDTSPCYGVSEEYIGEIASRRDDFILATKCGCIRMNSSFAHAFDGPTYLKNVENSLKVMKTDYIDILQIHGPMPQDIQGGETDEQIEALRKLKTEGKVRHIAATFKNSGPADPKYPDSYSYDCLKYFMEWDVFEVIQVVYGGYARKCETLISEAAAKGKGIIARGTMKRYFPYFEGLFEKAGLKELLYIGETERDFLIRFTLSHPDVTTAIIGTKDIGHLEANIKAANKGRLAPEVYAEAKDKLDKTGQAACYN